MAESKRSNRRTNFWFVVLCLAALAITAVTAYGLAMVLLEFWDKLLPALEEKLKP